MRLWESALLDTFPTFAQFHFYLLCEGIPIYTIVKILYGEAIFVPPRRTKLRSLQLGK